MADSDIPDELLQLQQVFDRAHTAVVTLAARPGPIAEWPAEDVTALEEAQTAERDAALALHRYRQDHPEWAPWPQQQRVQEAVSAGADA